jgi:hypothetical protein
MSGAAKRIELLESLEGNGNDAWSIEPYNSSYIFFWNSTFMIKEFVDCYNFLAKK